MTERTAIEWFENRIAVMPESETKEMFRVAISALKKQNSKQYVPDPWDGIKPHAPDGFVAKYCEPYQEEKNEPK